MKKKKKICECLELKKERVDKMENGFSCRRSRSRDRYRISLTLTTFNISFSLARRVSECKREKKRSFSNIMSMEIFPSSLSLSLRTHKPSSNPLLPSRRKKTYAFSVLHAIINTSNLGNSLFNLKLEKSGSSFLKLYQDIQ